MPQTTSTYAVIKATIQIRVADSATTIADATDWYDMINESCQDVIDDCLLYNAWDLLDPLQANTTITLVANQEEYNYITLITADSKTFHAHRKSMWGNYPVRVLDFHRYQDLLHTGSISASENKPFMCFVKTNIFKLRPIPTGNDTDNPFIMYYIKKFTKMTGTSDVPLLDHRCIPLLYPKAASKYWRRRRQFDLADREEVNYERGVRKIIKPFKKYPMYDVISTEGG